MSGTRVHGLLKKGRALIFLCQLLRFAEPVAGLPPAGGLQIDWPASPGLCDACVGVGICYVST